MSKYPSKAKKPTWSDVKQQLANYDRTVLLGLAQDLYQANKNNQIFCTLVSTWQTIICRLIKPLLSVRSAPMSCAINLSLSLKAKKAIDDYKKAVGSPADVVELSVCYCESCMNFLDTFGMDDKGYFDALVRGGAVTKNHSTTANGATNPFYRKLG